MGYPDIPKRHFYSMATRAEKKSYYAFCHPNVVIVLVRYSKIHAFLNLLSESQMMIEFFDWYFDIGV